LPDPRFRQGKLRRILAVPQHGKKLIKLSAVRGVPCASAATGKARPNSRAARRFMI